MHAFQVPGTILDLYLPLDLSITKALCIYPNSKALIPPVQWLECDRSILKDSDDSHRIWGGFLYVINRRPGMVTSQLGTVILSLEDYHNQPMRSVILLV